MFTLALVYALIYLSIFVSLLSLSFLQLPVQFITQLSTSNFLVIVQKYTRFKNLFLLLIFSLTGLPPVGLFFVKFNILTFVLYQTHVASTIGLFFIFFLNMLFYVQLLTTKNFKKPVYSVMNPEIFTYWQQSNLNRKNSTNYITYKLVLFVINILLLLFLMPLFFTDIYLVLSLI